MASIILNVKVDFRNKKTPSVDSLTNPSILVCSIKTIDLAFNIYDQNKTLPCLVFLKHQIKNFICHEKSWQVAHCQPTFLKDILYYNDSEEKDRLPNY